MECRITLTGNAGVFCQYNGVSLAVDALHNGPAAYWDWGFFSPDQILELLKLYERLKPEAVLYTHRHADHFSADMTEKALLLYKAPFVFPGTSDIKTGLYETRSFAVRWMELPHEKEEIHGRENYGFLLTIGDKTLLFPGDCTPGEPQVSELIKESSVDIAFLNFNWVGKRCGRKAIQEIIRPKHVVLLHFPTAKKDNVGYFRAVNELSSRFFPQLDIRMMRDYLQSETIDL